MDHTTGRMSLSILPCPKDDSDEPMTTSSSESSSLTAAVSAYSRTTLTIS